MNKTLVIVLALLLGLGVTGFVVYKAVFNAPASQNQQEEETENESIPDNTTVEVTVTESKSKDNTVVITVSKLDGNYASIGYEVTYETQGTFQGVNSGSKPLDVSGQKSFEREVYLGTCSRNVCKPHTGVTQVSVALEFTDSDGKKSQFSKDFPL